MNQQYVQETKEKPSYNLEESVALNVEKILTEKGININYDSQRKTCSTSYGMPLNIEFKIDKKLSNASLFKKKLEINIIDPVTSSIKSDEEIVAVLLHEKAHLDIAPLETPIATLSLSAFYICTKNFWLSALATGTYIVAREFLIEGLNYARYDFCRFNARRKGN